MATGGWLLLLMMSMVTVMSSYGDIIFGRKLKLLRCLAVLTSSSATTERQRVSYARNSRLAH